jgi:single-strand DNA-binding protein
MTNVWALEGNVVADATMKLFSESELTEFKIANSRYISKDKEKTTFVTCKMWGKRGVALLPYIVKGARLTVTGTGEIDEWEKDGQRHSKVVIRVDDVSLGAKRSASPSPARQEYGDEKVTANSGSSTVNDGDFTDDIPF